MVVAVLRGRALRSGGVCDDLDRSLQDSARREELFRSLLQPVSAPAHDDDLEAAVVIEVDMHRGAHLVSELVLDIRDAVRELANVMVVDERHAGKSLDATRRERSDDLGPGEVAKQL